MVISMTRWKPPRISQLTPIIIDMELTHLGSKVSLYKYQNHTIISSGDLSAFKRVKKCCKKIYKNTTNNT